MNDVMEGKPNFRNHHVYAVYRGDEYVTDGTLEEIGKTLGMTRKSLFWYLTPSAMRKLESKTKRGKTRNCITLTLLE